MEITAKVLNPYEKVLVKQPLYNAFNAIAPNRYELENDIIDVET